MTKRCVVTGIGIVSPVGSGKDAFWKSLTEGKSGIAPITYFDTSNLTVNYAGEVKDFDATKYVDETRLPLTGRYVHFAVGASKMAIEDAGISLENIDTSRFSLVGGTTAPACDSIESEMSAVLQQDQASLTVSPFAFASIVVHAATAEVAHELGCFDSATTISTVCTSGTNAIGAGLKEIRSGRKDIVLAGVSESTITYFTFIAYIAAGLLVENPDIPPEEVMRPYDKDRCGGAMSEGAAFVVLEELEHARLRNASIYGELAGYGYKGKFRGPKSTKQTMVNAMRAALADARMLPNEVDFVSANGVSVQHLDKIETTALKEVLGKHAYRVPVSAIKSMIGIPNSAVGPMQLVAALLSLKTDIVPPTINYETPDPDCDLDYVPNVARFNRVDSVLVNNHAFDGSVAALVAKRYAE